ncbi:hypothetical protein P170DRAFT_439757 [Aspergillus steynii IBT 23096]|uniref:Myb-like domain-containing protein n=1 Tax=Aspergillus steynii IBT 23096 TaxID=1392250 RepID=A0A2I2FZL5_9EURO|nr:uncharacterized protein P170DRAFT_439757 [Aspergillus steynii IBT 23096]PLB46064.1 hypothetical protein P170DRAFT_439757 [Aspergillus steynii IBT 23096]
MSSSSLYEPEEDEDASDSDFAVKPVSRKKAPPSSPPTDGLRQFSPADQDGQSPFGSTSRSSIGTRSQALQRLRISLPKESIETYGNLLDTTLDEKLPSTTDENATTHKKGDDYKGIVLWTPQEKKVFFNILDRKGKNGVREIAQAIGTKSELEVQEYLRLIHKGLEHQHLVDRHSRSVILGEIPAAAEVSRKCCQALDGYAELLQLEEQHSEDVAGRKRHRGMWIINEDAAAELDEQPQPQDEAFASDTSIHHTAGLLNIKSWIRLSERFFMNFGGPRLEDNWVNVAFADETPSVTADAFADFYSLAVSVTRRLIHSALFFAMSRLQSMRDTGNPKAKVIKSRDVQTALDVLNMKHDRFDYWVGLARRCNLDVADLRHRKGWNSVRMDYNEVEDILSDRVPLDPEPGGRSASAHKSQEVIGGDEEDRDSDDASDNGSAVSSNLSSPLSDEEEPLPEDPEEDHAEQVDQKANHLEEQQLWEIMGQSPPASLHSLIAKDRKRGSKLRKPPGERKTPEELVDWRNRTLYRGDWEEHGNGVIDIYEDISEHRRKRRRLEQPAVPLDPSDSSNDEISGSGSNSDSDDDVQNHEEAQADSSADEPDDMEVDRSHHASEYPPQSTSPPLNHYEDQTPLSPENGNPLFTQDKDFTPDLSTLQQHPQVSLATSSPSPVSSPSKSRYISSKPNPYHYQHGDHAPSSNSEDDLPVNHEESKPYSSEDEDDQDGIPLYSHPMSPTDWPTE